MDQMNPEKSYAIPDCVRYDLMRLNVPVHWLGYEQLCVGVALFAKDTTQPMCCELYPAIARQWAVGIGARWNFSYAERSARPGTVAIRKPGQHISRTFKRCPAISSLLPLWPSG